MNTIEEWEKDVKSYLISIKELLDNNEEAKNLYNGFYIWDSKLIYNPKIMFIGINPGNGNPNNDGSIKTTPEVEMSFLEYLDGNNDDYTLARETVEVFSHLGFNENEIRELLDNNSIKTNLYYIITSNMGKIENCLSKIGKKAEFGKKSFAFTSELIKIIKPNYVICEGKTVFNAVKSFYENKSDYDEIWNEDVGMLKIKDSELIYFGYKRNLNEYNNIKDIKGFAEMIRPYFSINDL
jgi:hypothetical protein